MPSSRTDVANMALLHLGGAPPMLTNVDTDVSKEATLLKQALDGARQAVLRLHPWNFATKWKKSTAVTMQISAIAASGVNTQLTLTVNTTDIAFKAGDLVQILTPGASTNGLDGTWSVVSDEAGLIVVIDAPFASITDFVASAPAIWRVPSPQWGYEHVLPSDFIRVIRVTDADEQTVEFESMNGRIASNEQTLYTKYIYDQTDFTKFDGLFYEAFALFLAWKVCYGLTQSNTARKECWELLQGVMKKARFTDSTERSMQELQADQWLQARDGRSTGFVRDPMT